MRRPAILLEPSPARLPSNNRDIWARKSRCSSPISNASSGLVACACVDPPARETSSCSPPPLRIYESWRSFGRRRRHSPRGQRERSPEPITGFMSDLSRKLPSTSTTERGRHPNHVRSATKSTKSAKCGHSSRGLARPFRTEFVAEICR